MVYNRQHASYGLPHHLTVVEGMKEVISKVSVFILSHVHFGEFGSGSTGDLVDSELRELGLELLQLLRQLILVLPPQLVRL